MNKIVIAAVLLAMLFSHSVVADESIVWVDTLPQHSVLCTDGKSRNPEDLDRALQSFAEPLAKHQVAAVGYPFVRDLSLTRVNDEAEEPPVFEAIWTVCAPAKSGSALVEGFVAGTVIRQLVAAILCPPPVAGCAQRLLTALKIPEESSRLASLRSVPIAPTRMPPSVSASEARKSAISVLLSTEAVRVTSSPSAVTSSFAPVQLDEQFVKTSAPRPLYVATDTPVEEEAATEQGLVVVIPISQEESQALAK